MSKIVIIGSGFGGLAAAIRLQSRGFDVSIFEKNENVGGHAYQLKINGYTFDMGPSLITAPDIIKGIFKAAEKNLADYVDKQRLAGAKAVGLRMDAAGMLWIVETFYEP